MTRSHRRLLLLLAVGCGLLAAGPALAEEPAAAPPTIDPGAYPPPGARVRLLVVGAAVTAGWYGGGVGLSYLWPRSDGARALRIPVAGPYMALARTGCGEDESSCGTIILVLRTVLTGLSAVGQTGGVLAMLEGVFLPTRGSGPPSARSGATARPPGEARREAEGPRVMVAPVLAGADPLGSGLGLGLVGTF